MSDILLDPETHDVLDTNGDFIGTDLSLVVDTEEIAQRLRQNLKFFFGEWFLDTRQGIPYYEQILKKNPNPVVVDSIFKSVIAKTDGVLELTEFSLDVSAERTLTLQFKAKISETTEVEIIETF